MVHSPCSCRQRRASLAPRVPRRRAACEGESNAVKVYVAYLRQKLNAAGEPDLIHAVRGLGYVLREQGRAS